MKYKKILRERQIIDHNTGQVLKEEVDLQIPDEPEFVKLYLDCVLKFKNLSKSLNPILLEFLNFMPYADQNNQTIYINLAMKKEIAAKLKISVKRVEQAITSFVKEEVFFRKDRGTYTVNPYIFGKGNWRDIYNIRATFDFRNRTIQSEFIAMDGIDSSGKISGPNYIKETSNKSIRQSKIHLHNFIEFSAEGQSRAAVTTEKEAI